MEDDEPHPFVERDGLVGIGVFVQLVAVLAHEGRQLGVLAGKKLQEGGRRLSGLIGDEALLVDEEGDLVPVRMRVLRVAWLLVIRGHFAMEMVSLRNCRGSPYPLRL